MSVEDSSSGPVSLGLFDWVGTDGVRPAGQLYRERLDLLADEQFTVVWRRHGDGSDDLPIGSGSVD